ncbi:hypothetical protein JW899_00815 [Candidatus Uhrbacteria bacterium]|nr:hypothetical protein [Candidatus Uhrbacteria bacterium]
MEGKTVRNFIVCLSFAFVAAAFGTFGPLASAPALALDTGLESTALHAGLSEGDDGSNADVAIIAGRVINALLGLVGVVFLVLVIFAGYKWMMARGNAKETEDAKNMLVQAVIGLLIIFAAYVLVDYLLGLAIFEVVGVDL